MDGTAVRLGSALELWVGLVREGEERMHVQLSEPVESYLVFLLQRHQRDAVLAGRILALEWLEAAERVGSARVDALQDVGDRCLLLAGMFPQQARRRCVDPGYYAAIGQSAYASVAQASRAGYATLFVQLTQAFDAMRLVLAGLAATPSTAIPMRRLAGLH